MIPTNELLKRNFAAEDTETWSVAARQLGLQGDAEVEFLRSQLADTENLTAQRHGWGMLAAYLEAISDEQAEGTSFELPVLNKGQLQTVSIGPWVREWLAGIVLRGLAEDGATIGEVRALPGVPERIAEQRSRLERELEEQRERGNERAVAAKAAAIAALGDDSTPLSRVKGLVPDPIHDEEWAFASFVACLSPTYLTRIGIPITGLIRTMTRLSITKAGQRIGYVIYGSKLVQDALDTGLIDGDTAAALLTTIADNLPPAPATNQGTWIEHISRLRRVIDTTGLSVEWDLAGCFADLAPERLGVLFKGWCSQPNEQAAMELARACLESFKRESCWREKSYGERLALAALILVVQEPGKQSTRWRIFSLDHRILIVTEAIERWREENQLILESLVRLLKVLFQQQLTKEMAKKDNGKVVEIARRQIFTIQPLVAAWNLRGVINKDLAAIAVQALSSCFDQCIAVGDLTEYRRLLYTMLYAIPELSLLRGMQRYVQSEDVAVHLEKILAFAVEDESTPEQLEKRYEDFARAVWKESAEPRLEGFLHVVTLLCPGFDDDEDTGNDSAVESATPTVGHLVREAREALRWMVRTRVTWEVEATNRFLAKASPTYLQEMDAEIDVRTQAAFREIDHALAAVIADRQTILDASQPEAYLQAMQRAVNALGVLRSLCRDELPFVERHVVGLKLVRAVQSLEKRLDQLSLIVEGEDEIQARELLAGQRTSSNGKKLIANWMLRRFMLTDLVPPGSVLQRLLDIRFVSVWILSPYLLSLLMALILGPRAASPNLQWLLGIPFIAIILGNIAIVLAYGFKKSNEIPGRLSRGHLIMPQMVGALFLGLMGAFQADESWSLAFLGSPIIRTLNIVVFLTASYLFIRLVMLGNQHPRGPVEEKIILNRRARSVMALGLWQSFALTSLFSLLMGSVMASSYRADLRIDELDALSRSLGRYIPHMITIGSPGNILSFFIFPWAILMWTVKLFFFSAIFERIMNRYGD